MNEITAQKAGVQAYKDGRGVAPALNQKFLVAASETGAIVKMMADYTFGWTTAMLADGQKDANMPSVIELARIEAA